MFNGHCAFNSMYSRKQICEMQSDLIITYYCHIVLKSSSIISSFFYFVISGKQIIKTVCLFVSGFKVHEEEWAGDKINFAACYADTGVTNLLVFI